MNLSGAPEVVFVYYRYYYLHIYVDLDNYISNLLTKQYQTNIHCYLHEVFLCLVRFDFDTNLCWHILHSYGLIPEWELRWIAKFVFRWAVYPQPSIGHVKSI